MVFEAERTKELFFWLVSIVVARLTVVGANLGFCLRCHHEGLEYIVSDQGRGGLTLNVFTTLKHCGRMRSRSVFCCTPQRIGALARY